MRGIRASPMLGAFAAFEFKDQLRSTIFFVTAAILFAFTFAFATVSGNVQGHRGRGAHEFAPRHQHDHRFDGDLRDFHPRRLSVQCSDARSPVGHGRTFFQPPDHRGSTISPAALSGHSRHVASCCWRRRSRCLRAPSMDSCGNLESIGMRHRSHPRALAFGWHTPHATGCPSGSAVIVAI